MNGALDVCAAKRVSCSKTRFRWNSNQLRLLADQREDGAAGAGGPRWQVVSCCDLPNAQR